ncbi:MAG TPA: hypothetical protein VGE57_07845 [Solimonas sp.]
MGIVTQDLFTVGMGGGSIRRYGRMSVLVLADTAVITTPQDVQRAQCWGRSIATSGTELQDRERLLDQLDTRVTRDDAACTTRGTPEALMRLVIQMLENGLALAGWQIPQTVLDAIPPRTTMKANVTEVPALTHLRVAVRRPAPRGV